MGRPIRLFLVLALGILLLTPATASAATLSVSQQRVLRQYAVNTWKSFVAMTSAKGLPSDNINADTRARSAFTSPTNIGAYMWSTLAARDLQIITPLEAQRRIRTTLNTLRTLERHQPSGQFYNWYNPDTGAKLTSWPVDNSTVYPFLSSVDNGWLAMTLMMIERAVPQLRAQAHALVSSMDFGFYYEGPDDPSDFDSSGNVVKENGPGLIRGGFWKDPPAGQCNIPGNNRTDDRGAAAGPPVYYTCHHYGSFNTEPRIASYVGIAQKQIPARHYWNGWRTFPDTCDWGWHEMKPEGVNTTYTGTDIAGNYSVTVYEGHYHYRGMNFVPTWGGSMFEALMVPLFVPEEEWGPRSWGVNHPLYVRGQIEHGLQEAHYGYWGFSPSNNPAGGYREYGVDPLGLNPDGYSSDQERTTVDYGFGECRPPQPPPASYHQGVVTPHASFLALDFNAGAALTNLSNIRRDFDSYGWGGFYDAINVGDPETGAGRGQVSRFYLALDQGMIMAAIGNALRGDRLQKYFVQGEVQAAIQPLMAKEVFTAGE